MSIRHGEAFLRPVDKAPKGKIEVHKSYVIAHSESGHHHVLESKTKFEVTKISDDELYVRLFKPAEIKHQKSFDAHKTLTIQPGLYKRYIAQEYDPISREMRRVHD